MVVHLHLATYRAYGGTSSPGNVQSVWWYIFTWQRRAVVSFRKRSDGRIYQNPQYAEDGIKTGINMLDNAPLPGFDSWFIGINKQSAPTPQRCPFGINTQCQHSHGVNTPTVATLPRCQHSHGINTPTLSTLPQSQHIHKANTPIMMPTLTHPRSQHTYSANTPKTPTHPRHQHTHGTYLAIL